MQDARHFLAVATAEAVGRAVAGGYVEINGGKAGPLERMRVGDALVYYSSPRERDGGVPLQAFTALAWTTGQSIYRAGIPDGDGPFRRAARYAPASPAPIRPLIDSLDFIRNKSHWGAALRFGFLALPAADFARVAEALGCRAEVPVA
jgi:EVE domain